MILQLGLFDTLMCLLLKLREIFVVLMLWILHIGRFSVHNQGKNIHQFSQDPEFLTAAIYSQCSHLGTWMHWKNNNWVPNSPVHTVFENLKATDQNRQQRYKVCWDFWIHVQTHGVLCFVYIGSPLSAALNLRTILFPLYLIKPF